MIGCGTQKGLDMCILHISLRQMLARESEKTQSTSTCMVTATKFDLSSGTPMSKFSEICSDRQITMGVILSVALLGKEAK